MKKIVTVLFISLILTIQLEAKDYTYKDNTQAFIDKMVNKHHFSRAYLEELFSDVAFQRRALSIFNPEFAINPRRRIVPPEHGSWDNYEKLLLKKERVQKGVEFMHKYRTLLKRVYRKYGVEPEYITAIIGIESHYGENRGKFPVFDVLTTLAFERNRRSKYFQFELEKFLLLSRDERFNPKNVMGSYAGAIGLGQFMPSSYDAFAVDFNRDGKRSIQNIEDATASIANYFKKHGWKKHGYVATRVSYNGNRFTKYKTGYKYKYDRSKLKGIKPKYGKWNYRGKVRLIKLDRKNYDELWYGAKNFYVITRYNHSGYYAMAVHQLAQKIKKAYIKKYGKMKDD